MRSAGTVAVPSTATKIATPIASAAWRIMLMTPDPVAKDDGGRAAAPTPIRVGKVRPTPIVETSTGKNTTERRYPRPMICEVSSTASSSPSRVPN